MKKLILIISCFFFGCENISVDKNETYDANLQKAFDLWQTTQECKTAKIDEYEFQSAKVYVFDPGLCGADMFSPVYDANGKVFCNLGGILGNVKCSNVNFDENAKFIKTVWKK